MDANFQAFASTRCKAEIAGAKAGLTGLQTFTAWMQLKLVVS